MGKRQALQQKLMRGRVAAQGFTICCMIGGVIWHQSYKEAPPKNTVTTQMPLSSTNKSSQQDMP